MITKERLAQAMANKPPKEVLVWSGCLNPQLGRYEVFVKVDGDPNWSKVDMLGQEWVELCWRIDTGTFESQLWHWLIELQRRVAK